MNRASLLPKPLSRLTAPVLFLLSLLWLCVRLPAQNPQKSSEARNLPSKLLQMPAGMQTVPGNGTVRPPKPIQKEIRINAWRGGRVVKVWRGDPSRKEVALTFDDGPHPAYTVRLLDLLQELHVKATFFVVGKKVDEAPSLLLRMVQDGHEVANHTYHHLNLDGASEDLVMAEIRLGAKAIHRACGVEPISFRPPGGHHNANVLLGAEKLNLRTFLWSDDPADFANPGADVIEKRLLGHVSNGALILLHDGIEQTLDILPDLIARLRRDGYRFVTVTELAQHLEASERVHG